MGKYVLEYSRLCSALCRRPECCLFCVWQHGTQTSGVDNEVVIREIMHISVSFNHDLVDGAPAARFLNRFRYYVEKFPQMVMDD
ncbi:2-oxo acid dehydrogenase subunit E2 [Pleomorphochaeta sp. DL1XJH-081]|uniref:2-oxo acid dehydrogenase subunit E2 n=1 Tax=Pleomorphochaeta sp. DL1XJH-081 TaxID=3409690 RepID=UPI003BB4B83F